MPARDTDDETDRSGSSDVDRAPDGTGEMRATAAETGARAREPRERFLRRRYARADGAGRRETGMVS
jgi:hypothetical protein